MKKWLPLALALALAGCNTPSSAPTDTSAGSTGASTLPPSTGSTPTSSATATAGSPTTTPPATGSTSQTPVKVNTDARTGEDPNRIYQLKDLKVTTLTANGHKIKAWLMDDNGKRQEGMMFLKDKDVRPDEGMLFIWPAPELNDGRHGFWMHNCPLGLDICYIGANKKVVNVADGKPYDDTQLPPAGDYQYVLEMKTNCAKKLGIKKGTPIQIPSDLKSLPDS